ncbi:coiled-coil domain-containing protein 167 [Pseudonaja textilis]|nr:coiled-coil domain-containing protein 167 [Pseudonaja textilis]
MSVPDASVGTATPPSKHRGPRARREGSVARDKDGCGDCQSLGFPHPTGSYVSTWRLKRSGEERSPVVHMSQHGPRGGRKMVEKAEGLSIAQQVESLEDKLTLCRQALEEVDFKLRRKELTSARRESLEKEKNMLETKAEIYEKELKMLRHENRKTVALSAAIILLVFVIYTCWTM